MSSPSDPPTGADKKEQICVASGAPSSEEASAKIAAEVRRKRRKDLFGDCALVEIIHLHDCLRGAVRALQRDVTELSRTVLGSSSAAPASSAALADCSSTSAPPSSSATSASLSASDVDRVAELERRVAGRFKVIWSVFRAHSAAEDEFIWPALQSKQSSHGRGGGQGLQQQAPPAEPGHGAPGQVEAQAAAARHDGQVGNAIGGPGNASPVVIEQEEYEEDHADEERMFKTMDTLLSQLRAGLSEQRRRLSLLSVGAPVDGSAPSAGLTQQQQQQQQTDDDVHEMARKIDEITNHLSDHLMAHLDKEETHCMPLVVEHLNKEEIHDLVGQIMGKRSSDLMSEIMTMAVQNLSEADRDEMVQYMKQAMVGTFFERWLSMGGWMADDKDKKGKGGVGSADDGDDGGNMKGGGDGQGQEQGTESTEDGTKTTGETEEQICSARGGGGATGTSEPAALCSMCSTAGRCLGGNGSADSTAAPFAVDEASAQEPADAATSPEEMEKLIRAIVSNPELTPVQKNTTIQGLRDSVWKSQVRQNKRKRGDGHGGSELSAGGGDGGVTVQAAAPAAARGSRRVTPPSSYWRKGAQDGTVHCVWSSHSPSTIFPPDNQSIPLFSASELAPTYFDGATGAVLGCPHYARSCKLRHPSSGRLYTCRLCCEQEREMPMKDQDSPLDRYAVTEVLCMTCGALQPVDDKCCNPKCESRGKPFAKYCCKICHFFDDGPQKTIYHCPFCNVCRSGRGLGIDYRHCMRCNACVSLTEDEHNCIPQRLQGNCPICHESMFQSTEPLRGLKCGHVMHLSCFGMYLRGHSYTCPLCKKSVEDMKEYFALLDAAVRMQPMPVAYADTMSNIYCQDCGKTGQVRYHFVGCKCSHCGSYNTRELGRVEGAPAGIVQY